MTMKTTKVYVVSWEYWNGEERGGGGFFWYDNEADARAQFEVEKSGWKGTYSYVRLTPVEVPVVIPQTRKEITKYRPCSCGVGMGKCMVHPSQRYLELLQELRKEMTTPPLTEVPSMDQSSEEVPGKTAAILKYNLEQDKRAEALLHERYKGTPERLEYLRSQLQAGSISWGELGELQDYAAYIDPGDVELLEAAGVPEFPDEAASKERRDLILALLQSIAIQAVALQDCLDTLDSDEDMVTLRGIDHALDVLMEEPDDDAPLTDDVGHWTGL